jgi:hypothetical protein
LPAAPRLGLQAVDEIDSVVKAAMFAAAKATAGDRYGEMSLAGAGPADQDTVALLGEKIALSEITHEALIDRRAFKLEVVEVLCQGQLGDPDLVLDRAGLLFADFGLQQIAAQASLRRLRKLVCVRGGSCWRLMPVAMISS